MAETHVSEKGIGVWHAACLPALDQAPTPDLHTATGVPGIGVSIGRAAGVNIHLLYTMT